MNTIIINILCEGQTEERFVKEVLKPYFKSAGIVLKHRLLVTSKRKNAYGGMLSYSQVKGDLTKWMKENKGRASETHFYTTMFDFYALPDDFPGFSEANGCHDPYQKVKRLEEAFQTDIDNLAFIPYIQLHEFEALCFCDIRQMISLYPAAKRQIEQLANVLDTYDGNPELINNSPQTAPSKRIISSIEACGQYHYNKPMTGATVTQSIGIDKLMNMCQHFREWINQLEDSCSGGHSSN